MAVVRSGDRSAGTVGGPDLPGQIGDRSWDVDVLAREVRVVAQVQPAVVRVGGAPAAHSVLDTTSEPLHTAEHATDEEFQEEPGRRHETHGQLRRNLHDAVGEEEHLDHVGDSQPGDRDRPVDATGADGVEAVDEIRHDGIVEFGRISAEAVRVDGQHIAMYPQSGQIVPESRDLIVVGVQLHRRNRRAQRRRRRDRDVVEGGLSARPGIAGDGRIGECVRRIGADARGGDQSRAEGTGEDDSGQGGRVRAGQSHGCDSFESAITVHIEPGRLFSSMHM